MHSAVSSCSLATRKPHACGSILYLIPQLDPPLVKVKLSLCLTEHHAMKAYWGVGYSSTHSLISALDGGEWSASCPGRFTNRERAPGINWIGGWVVPRAVLDTAVVKRKIPSSRRQSNPRTPIVLRKIKPGHILTPCFVKVDFNIIIPSAPTSSKW
jgi:hypothetical protein